MGRVVAAIGNGLKQDGGEARPGSNGMVAINLLAGVVPVWDKLEEGLARPGAGRLGASHISDDFGCLGVVPDDAGCSLLLEETRASDFGGRGFVFLRVGAGVFWLAAYRG
jgi:hypothetical protein